MKILFCLFVLLVSGSQGDFHNDFDYLVAIFPGLYDNIDQYKADAQHALPPLYRHKHLITTAVPENIPILAGNSNFYLEQYLNGNQSDLIRQRIYSFSIDDEQRIVLKTYRLVDEAKYAHAKPFSPLFEHLTAKDILYNEGCDIFFMRVATDLFKTTMFNTCIKNVDGAQVLFTNHVTLSSKYLTTDEIWTFVKNGSILHQDPNPYNMTRQGRIPHNRSLRSAGSSSDTFKNILNALVQGQPVRYFIRTSRCRILHAAQAASVLDMGGYIDTFEYFHDPTYGPQPYFGFNSLAPRRNATGGLEMHLREGLVYETGDVIIKHTVLSPDFGTVLELQNISCSLSKTSNDGSAAFFITQAKVKQMMEFPSVVSLLKQGARMRFVSNYEFCSLGLKAIGGSDLQDYEVAPDGSMLKVSQFKLITNYQGPGFVHNYVTSTFYFNGTVVFTASDQSICASKTYYSEVMYCQLNDLQQTDGGVYLYLLQ